jgi:hypothetical protein
MNTQRKIVVFSLALIASTPVFAAERQAYKIVDEKGNVTYSQTPPTLPKKVEKVDISPANSGGGGNTVSNDLRQRQYNQSEYLDQRNQMMQSEQNRRQDAERQRIESLKNECNRNRGSDCDNPETLRLIEAQRIPGGRAYR